MPRVIPKSCAPNEKLISLRIDHLNECIKIDELVLNGLWSKSQWEKELTNSESFCLGAFSESNLLAFICGSLILDELHLTS